MKEDYYDGIAKGYDELYKEEQLSKWDSVKEVFDFRNGLVLDAGCGTGFVTREFENVIGVDNSFKMLESCPESVRVVNGSLEHLPFKNNVFDVVFSLTVLQDIKNIKRGVREFKRVLKPNGGLCVSVLNKNKVKKIRSILKEHFPNLREELIGKDVLFLYEDEF